MTIILAAGGWFIHSVLDARLRDEFDAVLRDKSRYYELSAYFAPPNGRMRFGSGRPDFLEKAGKVADDYAEVDFRGELSFRAPHEWDGHLPLELAVTEQPRYADMTLPDGRPGRALGLIIYPPWRENLTSSPRPMVPPVGVKLVVARETVSLAATQRKLRSFLLFTGLGSVLIVMAAAALLVWRGLQPIGELDRQIDVMPLAEPGRRFSLPGAPSELEPVVSRLNALMNRVTAAIEHERQFTSNAAHELRNPLAAIRAQCETALSRTRTAEQYEDTLAGILESQNGMQRVVEHLLMLARLESGHHASEFIREPAELQALLRRCWRGCVDRAAERRLSVVWQITTPEARLLLPVSLAEMVITNLMDNAVSYTPERGRITISAECEAGSLVIRVENSSPGMTPEQMEQSFSPFWRADPNASGHRGNAGIGLALCRRIADTLDGTLTGRLADGTVCYELRIPALLRTPVPPTEA